MDLRGKKLGVLISCAPDQPGFHHGLRTAQAALQRGINVYLYCIDDAVQGITDPLLQRLKNDGLNLYACAYGAHKRHIALSDNAAFAGLTVVNDLMVSTDRFLAFH